MAGIKGGLVGGSALDDELKQSNVVRLRGLPFTAVEDDIIGFFKGLELGPDGVVICVNFQGRSTGQAYVQFINADVANKALDKNRQHMGSRYIEVFKGHWADMQGALRMVGRANANSNETGSNVIGTSIPGVFGNPDMGYTGVIRMRGLPFSCTAADITAFFRGMQIIRDGIFLCTQFDGRPTGEAFVEFSDEEAATQAMQLHREPMGSRYVELFRSTKGEMMSAVQRWLFVGLAGIGTVPSMPGMAGGFGLQSLAGLNTASLHSAGLAGVASLQGPGNATENICIKMRGLPYSATVREIADFFDGYKIVPNGIRIVTGFTDRPTGEAFVEFVSSDEAQSAMARDRRNIGSRYIELFRATKSEMILATGGISGFSMGQAVDPGLQLLLLQQQVGTMESCNKRRRSSSSSGLESTTSSARFDTHVQSKLQGSYSPTL